MTEMLSKAFEAFERTEPDIRAWVSVEPQSPLGNGVLDGVPFGVKDIFETTDLVTEYGSPLYKGRKGEREASVITQLRQAGGVLFGKTQTAAFAYFDPPPTRNPRNLAHTPGGSSSGSAAAVAAGVVPFALGTQTMGSVIRPASFCGVSGFKPTFGILPTDGVLAFAPSLDTVGILADTPATCRLVWRALGYSTDTKPSSNFAAVIDLPPTSLAMLDAFEAASERIPNISTMKLPEPYERLLAAARLVNDYEGARSHYERWREFGDAIGRKLSSLVTRGMQISDNQYDDSLRYLRATSEVLDKQLAYDQVLLTPAAPGAAPEGLGSTGDPIMNAVWTALGMPVVTLPMPHGGGLPLGMQLISRRGADNSLLETACRMSQWWGSSWL